jgi:hypothetical protein
VIVFFIAINKINYVAMFRNSDEYLDLECRLIDLEHEFERESGGGHIGMDGNWYSGPDPFKDD